MPKINGKLIKQRRELLGLTLEAAAELAGMDRKQWQRYENEESHYLPSKKQSENLKAITTVLNTSIDMILGRRSDKHTISHSGMAISDFNDDNIPDMAVACKNGICLLISGKDGVLNAQVHPTGRNPAYIEPADIDGDGKEDLIAVNPEDNSLSVLYGNGDGTFRQKQISDVGVKPYLCFVRDVNGDGLPDITVYSETSVKTFLNQGNRSFVEDIGKDSARPPPLRKNKKAANL